MTALTKNDLINAVAAHGLSKRQSASVVESLFDIIFRCFEKGEDVHSRTAAETFGVPAGDVTTEQRRIAKVLNFGIAYVIGAFGLAHLLVKLPPSRMRSTSYTIGTLGSPASRK